MGVKRTIPTLAAAALLGIFILLAVGSMAQKSATFDEVSHLPAGYAYLRTGLDRLNPEHPMLVKVLAAAPLLFLDLPDPRDFGDFWHDEENYALGNQWLFGKAFLYESGVDADALLFRARIPMVLLAAVLGLGIFLWSREVHGKWGGLISLCLFAFSPNLLAHGRLVTTDGAIATFSTLTVYALWKNLSDPPGRWWIGYGAGLTCALLAKYTVVLLFPSIGLVVLMWAIQERPSRDVVRRVFLRVSLATGIPLVGVLLVGFGPSDPLGYLDGFRWSLEKLNPKYAFYLNGEFSYDGFFSYYGMAFLVKTPVPTIILIGASLIAVRKMSATTLIALGIPILFFFLAPTIRRYNIGLRYILPVYPFLFVLAGGVVHVARDRKALTGVAGILLLWLAVGTVMAFPHYIPYFNEIAGGPENGLAWLDDSNIDWGQETRAFAEVAREEGWEGIPVLFAAGAPPEYYLPRCTTPPPEELLEPERDQVYAVSVQIVNRVPWFRERTPVRKVGHSIYIYRGP